MNSPRDAFPRASRVRVFTPTAATDPEGPFRSVRDNDITPLHFSASIGDYEQVMALSELLSFSSMLWSEDSLGRLPLQLAAGSSRPESVNIVRLMLDRGAEINEVDHMGRTALFYAARVNNVAVAELLIGMGADVNHVDVRRETALHAAAINGAVDVMRVLIDAGADIEAEDQAGCTPLFNSCASSRETASHSGIQLLIEKHANVDAADRMGNSVLFYTVYGTVAAVARITQMGLTPNVQNVRGERIGDFWQYVGFPVDIEMAFREMSGRRLVDLMPPFEQVPDSTEQRYATTVISDGAAVLSGTDIAEQVPWWTTVQVPDTMSSQDTLTVRMTTRTQVVQAIVNADMLKAARLASLQAANAAIRTKRRRNFQKYLQTTQPEPSNGASRHNTCTIV